MIFSPFGFKYVGSLSGQIATPPLITLPGDDANITYWANDAATLCVNPVAASSGGNIKVIMNGNVMPAQCLNNAGGQNYFTMCGVIQSLTYTNRVNNELVQNALWYEFGTAVPGTLTAEVIMDPFAIYSVQLYMPTPSAQQLRSQVGEFVYIYNSDTVTLQVPTYIPSEPKEGLQVSAGNFSLTNPSNQAVAVFPLTSGALYGYYTQLPSVQAQIIGLTPGIDGNAWGQPNPIVNVVLVNNSLSSWFQGPDLS